MSDTHDVQASTTVGETKTMACGVCRVRPDGSRIHSPNCHNWIHRDLADWQLRHPAIAKADGR